METMKIWKGRRCTLATMHEKEKVMAPLLETELGVCVVVPESFDTDQFGTFTREIKRSGTQLEAARSKALAGMKLLNCDLGIASEGSFGAHPSIPFIKNNLEIVLLIDLKNDLEIIGHHRSSEVEVKGREVRSVNEALETATSWGFPEQGIVVRLSEKSNKHIYKEIRTIEEMKDVCERLLAKWFVKSIFLETDMRAHRSPGRMNAIRLATIDLIKNCQQLCPRCGAPGFVVTSTVKGLPCSSCQLPSEIVKAVIYSCQKCPHQMTESVTEEKYAEPKDCAWCNP